MLCEKIIRFFLRALPTGTTDEKNGKEGGEQYGSQEKDNQKESCEEGDEEEGREEGDEEEGREEDHQEAQIVLPFQVLLVNQRRAPTKVGVFSFFNPVFRLEKGKKRQFCPGRKGQDE